MNYHYYVFISFGFLWLVLLTTTFEVDPNPPTRQKGKAHTQDSWDLANWDSVARVKSKSHWSWDWASRIIFTWEISGDIMVGPDAHSVREESCSLAPGDSPSAHHLKDAEISRILAFTAHRERKHQRVDVTYSDSGKSIPWLIFFYDRFFHYVWISIPARGTATSKKGKPQL